jgi:hypothetical protein
MRISTACVPVSIFVALTLVGCASGSEDDRIDVPLSEAGSPANPAPSTGSDASTDAAAVRADAATGPSAEAGSSLRDASATTADTGPALVTDASGSAPDAGTSSDAGGGEAGEPAPSEGALFAAPDGKDSASGSMQDPTSLASAIKRVAPGGVIEVRAGTYAYATQLTIEVASSGMAGKLKLLRAYAKEKPVLDFSTQPYGTGSNPRGLQINADYWHVVGLEVKGSADNGIYVAGKHNVIESCVTHNNRDTGLQIGRAASSQATLAEWPADNLILNCESYDNYDAPPGSGENADGFAAKLTVGPGNVFRGCVAHHNSDDGWDLYTKTDTGPIGSVSIDQCIAHHNGTLTNGTTNANGDRNGFKLGGEKIAVGHTVTRSIAFANGKNGFTWNSNPGAIRMFNNLAFDNAEGNFLFGSSSVSTEAVFANNVSFWTSLAADKSDKTMGSELSSSNAFWDASKSQPSINGKGLIVTAADFAAALTSPSLTRAADGSLNLAPFALAQGSDLANAGVTPPGTLPFAAAGYYVGAPDLGAVELH